MISDTGLRGVIFSLVIVYFQLGHSQFGIYIPVVFHVPGFWTILFNGKCKQPSGATVLKDYTTKFI